MTNTPSPFSSLIRAAYIGVLVCATPLAAQRAADVYQKHLERIEADPLNSLYYASQQDPVLGRRAFYDADDWHKWVYDHLCAHYGPKIHEANPLILEEHSFHALYNNVNNLLAPLIKELNGKNPADIKQPTLKLCLTDTETPFVYVYKKALGPLVLIITLSRKQLATFTPDQVDMYLAWQALRPLLADWLQRAKQEKKNLPILTTVFIAYAAFFYFCFKDSHHRTTALYLSAFLAFSAAFSLYLWLQDTKKLLHNSIRTTLCAHHKISELLRFVMQYQKDRVLKEKQKNTALDEADFAHFATYYEQQDKAKPALLTKRLAQLAIQKEQLNTEALLAGRVAVTPVPELAIQDIISTAEKETA